MKMPKFKPTKWTVYQCNTCDYVDDTIRGYCKQQNHIVNSKENIPFFVSDMEFTWVGQKWSGLHSKAMNKNFMISASRLEKIIKGCGIQAGGKMPNKWWMYSKVGSSLSLILIDA